ncbi:TPA: hypothetical protein OV568_003321, partial [Acinetobacter baumannii]|uniref:hypothetical protein n=1 Tax=Acinetobacter baumannii TaxID=470 RepID=UPI00229802FC|nr:class I SAM-dependent methyltransferase [Acinetobacter baumannii]MDC4754188.1 class I SAM-dependent methyltransferase [Acinetobacter baumannii]MDC5112844.1 class I SAM-dependent methyltransferase [Acinetobacter baumannii]MDC5127054.1 class I SAM-dependent methyltransferase [Acinetobacter baumannii]MDC5370297.1 class I SAM-dependent methyltransferase [Acinetobacter baumannii]
MNFNISSLEILNPKLKSSKKGGQTDSALYSYYAGFSEEFTTSLLTQLTEDKSFTIFDTWNGSGTTTFSAYKLGCNAIGNDLNPVMLIVAKARLINNLDLCSLEAVCQTIFYNTFKNKSQTFIEHDPLCNWFSKDSVSLLRKLESTINKNFICFDNYSPLFESNSINQLSTIGAFIYVILFKTIRTLLSSFIPSNPTWVKKPKLESDKIIVSKYEVQETFFKILHNTIENHAFSESHPINTKLELHLNSSTKLQQDNNSVDIILTSPPYCTRIDYAIATSIELAIIRVNDIRPLRDNLIGTSTIKKERISKEAVWGKTCNSFLERVSNHSSVASSTYYYKNHLQYFHDLYLSISEISRILKPNGLFIPIVQNSFYKEINNNLPQVITEMAEQFGLKLLREDLFPTKNTMSSINTKSNKYIAKKQTSESVLIFTN